MGFNSGFKGLNDKTNERDDLNFTPNDCTYTLSIHFSSSYSSLGAAPSFFERFGSSTYNFHLLRPGCS